MANNSSISKKPINNEPSSKGSFNNKKNKPKLSKRKSAKIIDQYQNEEIRLNKKENKKLRKRLEKLETKRKYKLKMKEINKLDSQIEKKSENLYKFKNNTDKYLEKTDEINKLISQRKSKVKSYYATLNAETLEITKRIEKNNIKLDKAKTIANKKRKEIGVTRFKRKTVLITSIVITAVLLIFWGIAFALGGSSDRWPWYVWGQVESFPDKDILLEHFEEKQQNIIVEDEYLEWIKTGEEIDDELMEGLAESFLLETGLVDEPDYNNPNEKLVFDGERKSAVKLKDDLDDSANIDLPDEYEWIVFKNFSFQYTKNIDLEDPEAPTNSNEQIVVVTYEASEVEMISYTTIHGTSTYKMSWGTNYHNVMADPITTNNPDDEEWFIKYINVELNGIQNLEVLDEHIKEKEPEEPEEPTSFEDEPVDPEEPEEPEEEFDYESDNYLFTSRINYQISALNTDEINVDATEEEILEHDITTIKQSLTTGFAFQRDRTKELGIDLYIHDFAYEFSQDDNAPDVDWTEEMQFLPIKEFYIIEMIDDETINPEDRIDQIEKFTAENVYRKSTDHQIADKLEFWNYTVNDDLSNEGSRTFSSNTTIRWLLEAKYFIETMEPPVYDYGLPEGDEETGRIGAVVQAIRDHLVNNGFNRTQVNDAILDTTWPTDNDNPGPGQEIIQQVDAKVTQNQLVPGEEDYTINITLTLNLKGA